MSEVIISRTREASTSEFRQGWPIVLACFCTAVFAWGFGFYGQSVYFADLQQTRGWTASLIASATTVYYLAGAVLLTRVHRAITLFGPRLMLSAGAIVLGLGAIGLSRVQAPWQLYACGIVMAIGWAATTTTAIAMTLACWFDRRRGLALSLALNGASAGGFTIAPLLVRLVHSMGFAHAVALLVPASLAILLPIVVFGVSPIAAHEQAAPPQRGDATTQVMRSLNFWTIAAPFALALAAQVGFIVHQVAFLLPHLGSAGAGSAIAATAIAASVGRLALAPVIDRVDQRIASAASFTSQAAGLGLMLAMPNRPEALFIGSVVFGLSVGNVITLPALIVQREFPAQAFGVAIGWSSMVGQATLAFGPTLLGLARDATGSYEAAIGLCIVLQLAGAILVLVRTRSS